MSKLGCTALLLLLSLGGCSDLDRVTDCSEICHQYRECISRDYDVDECEDRCNRMEGSRQSAAIDRCEDCLDDKSCVGSVFNCSDECKEIVP